MVLHDEKEQDQSYLTLKIRNYMREVNSAQPHVANTADHATELQYAMQMS